MKYNININQKAIIDNSFNLDLIDCAIIDYIKDFNWTWKMIKSIIDWDEYFWIQYEHFLKEMPLLWINSKQALKRRIDKIVNEWILEKKLLNWNSTYFRFWVNYCLLIWDTGVVWKVEGAKYKNNRGGSMKSLSINNNTNNNIINNNINIIKPKKQVFEESSFEYKTSKSFLDFHINIFTPSICYQSQKKWRENILQEWSKEIFDLKNLDKFSEKLITDVINYTLQDDFWKKQILSIAKFRKKKDWVSYFIKMIDQAKFNKEDLTPKTKKWVI